MTKHCLTTETQHPLQRCANVEIAVRLHMEPGTRDRRPSPNRNGNSRSPPVSIWNRELDFAAVSIWRYGISRSQPRSPSISISNLDLGVAVRLRREPGIRDHRPSPSRTGISRSSPVSMWNQAFEIAVRLHIDTGSQDRRPSASGTGNRPSPYHRPSPYGTRIMTHSKCLNRYSWMHPKCLT